MMSTKFLRSRRDLQLEQTRKEVYENKKKKKKQLNTIVGADAVLQQETKCEPDGQVGAIHQSKTPRSTPLPESTTDVAASFGEDDVFLSESTNKLYRIDSTMHDYRIDPELRKLANETDEQLLEDAASSCEDTYFDEFDGTYVPETTHSSTTGCFAILCYTLGIVGYLWDVSSDIRLAVEYRKLGHQNWFLLTIVNVLCTSVTMTIFSLILYARDYFILKVPVSRTMVVFRVLLHLLLLAPLCRGIETLYYGCKSMFAKDDTKKKAFYKAMVAEDVDSMLLRLFETFMEAAPQLVLQLYIMFILRQTDAPESELLLTYQVISLLSSWFILAYTLISFNRVLRLSQYPKKASYGTGISSYVPVIPQLLWRLCTIAARVVALVLFATHFRAWVFLVMGIHWIMMVVGLSWQNSQYCTIVDNTGKARPSRPLELCFRIMMGFVHIFCFLNLIEGHTRLRIFVFYLIMYAENIAITLVWYLASPAEITVQWYAMAGIAVVFITPVVGISFMVVYYMCFHPNNKQERPDHVQEIRLWVPFENLSLFRDQSQFVGSKQIVKKTTSAEIQSVTCTSDLNDPEVNDKTDCTV